MSTFVIIERKSVYVEWHVEAETADEARRAFVECGDGEQVDIETADDSGIVSVTPLDA